jgi:hypothetical protein
MHVSHGAGSSHSERFVNVGHDGHCPSLEGDRRECGGYPSQPCGLRPSIELRENASLSDAIAVFYRKTLIGRQ